MLCASSHPPFLSLDPFFLYFPILLSLFLPLIFYLLLNAFLNFSLPPVSSLINVHVYHKMEHDMKILIVNEVSCKCTLYLMIAIIPKRI